MSASKLNHRFELVANVLTIGTCLAVCGLAGVRMYQQSAAQLPDVFPPDTVLQSTEQVRFGARPLTLLVGLQSTCRYCAESMPAFRQLETYVKSRNDEAVSIVAIGAESTPQIRDYLATNGLTGYRPISVSRSSLLAPVAIRTPSVVLVNSLGVVLESWPGLLTNERLEGVIDRIETALAEQAAPSRGLNHGGG